MTVRLRFVESETLPAGERLWAEPVDAHDGGGTYRLKNTSFSVALVADGVVRAELDGTGDLQVVEVVQSGPLTATYVEVAAHVDDTARDAMLDRWRAAGAEWTEGCPPVLLTIWELDLDAIAARLPEVDFDLDPVDHCPPVETSYWAADDPWWAEHGLAPP